ncbi:hypothetical protein ABZ342_10595 [Amycolatopsis sp. NPDC005961]|uniref:hypothetical protein n=1 Tax=Amycolatopsis sp. NPDC005961 TaxID=3156720 RepID=UPI0033C372E6
MPVVVLTLLVATVAVAGGLLVKMFRHDEPLFGGLGICLLVGPGSLLAFVHVGLTEF